MTVASVQVASRLSDKNLAGRVLEGQVLLNELRSATGLAKAAEQVLDMALEVGCTNLVAGGPEASALLAAVSLLHGDRLQLASERQVREGTVAKVLVVEPVVITGTKVRKRVAQLRSAGAAWVGVAIVHDLDENASTCFERFGGPDAVLANRVSA